MNTEQLRRRLERLAVKKFGPRGQGCPDVKVVVVNEKAGTSLDYDISKVGYGEPGQIVIFVNEIQDDKAVTDDDPDWPDSVVQNIVDEYTDEWLVRDADVQSQGTLTELCGETINRMTAEGQTRILDAFGGIDLSDPTVDLSCGWRGCGLRPKNPYRNSGPPQGPLAL